MFNYLCIFNHVDKKLALYGWKIYTSLEEYQEMMDYHKGKKFIDFYLGNNVYLKYDNFSDLQNDVELVPLKLERASVLTSIFESDTFGVFPI
jgi:hypothetical protein